MLQPLFLVASLEALVQHPCRLSGPLYGVSYHISPSNSYAHLVLVTLKSSLTFQPFSCLPFMMMMMMMVMMVRSMQLQPFILYNIPSVDATAGRWSSPDYMEKIFGSKTQYATEHSTDNHFMYFNHKLVSFMFVGFVVFSRSGST